MNDIYLSFANFFLLWTVPLRTSFYLSPGVHVPSRAMMVQPTSNPDAKGPYKGRKEVAPQFQEEHGLFPEN